MGSVSTSGTVAELLESLGGVPAGRVLARPAPGTATEADAARLLGRQPRRVCELIDGTLVEKAMGWGESSLTAVLIEILGAFVRSRNLGVVTGPDGAVLLAPGCVRVPDVSFVSWERLPGRERPTDAVPGVVPDLAAEVLSAGNTAGEMERKRREYFGAGVRLVWEVDPRGRSVTAYTSAEEAVVLGAGDVLEGGEVLPGFALPLGELFAELDRHG